jgi:ATP-dependent Clp protease ATP-binding subunit ClpC
LKEGFDEEYGARPLRRAIQTYIDDVLADALLANEISNGQTVELIVSNERIIVRPLEVLQH